MSRLGLSGGDDKGSGSNSEATKKGVWIGCERWTKQTV